MMPRPSHKRVARRYASRTASEAERFPHGPNGPKADEWFRAWRARIGPYMRGACYDLAGFLHDEGGFPVWGVIDEDGIIAHAFAYNPRIRKGLDARGEVDPEDMMDGVIGAESVRPLTKKENRSLCSRWGSDERDFAQQFGKYLWDLRGSRLGAALRTATSTKIPAKTVYAGGWEWNKGGFADWPSFRRKPKREQIAWAKEYVGSGIREPVEVTVYSDGGVGFTDGHHRVMAGTLLDIEIPVRVKFRNFDKDLWPDLLALLKAGYTPKQYNPQGWKLTNSGVPPLEVVRRGPNAADEWIMSNERVKTAARPIRLPTREIKALAKKLAQRLYQWGLPKPGRVIAQEYLPLTNVMGDEVEVEILLTGTPNKWRDPFSSELVQGGFALTHKRSDNPLVRIFVNPDLGTRTFEMRPRRIVESELYEILAHELTHAADTWLGKGSAVGALEGLGPGSHHNHPAEVKALMRDVVTHLEDGEYVRELMGYGMDFNTAFREALKETQWPDIEPYLTPKNQKTILKGVYTHLQDQGLTKAASRTAGGFRRIIDEIEDKTGLEAKVEAGADNIKIELKRGTKIVGYFRASTVDPNSFQWKGAPLDCKEAWGQIGEPPVWIVRGALLSWWLRGKGFGKLLYKALFSHIASKKGVVGPNRCSGGNTSPDAQRVWKSLRSMYPKHGPLIDLRKMASASRVASRFRRMEAGMRTVKDLPDDWYVEITGSLSNLGIYLLDGDDNTVGSLDIHRTGDFLQINEIQARQGWGPLLYDLAMEVANEFNDEGLMPDRSSVSREARAVWEHYLNRRSDVEATLLPEWVHELAGSGHVRTHLDRYEPDSPLSYSYRKTTGNPFMRQLALQGQLESDDYSFDLPRAAASRVASRYAGRAYCICWPTDGLLYVEVPSYDHLRNLLLTQKWRGDAHLRTKDGYVPYFGGGIAFSFTKMRMKGVHPVWYIRKGFTKQQAVAHLVEDGLFVSERDALRHAEGDYPGECEWKGKKGLSFTPDAIEYVWLGKRAGKPFDEAKAELHQFIPDLDVRSEAPPSGNSPCRVASRFRRMEAGLLQAPPKLVKAVTEWAQATFADRAHHNALAKQAKFDRTGAGIIGGQDTLDLWFKSMKPWKRTSAGKGGEVSTTFDLTDYLDGWRYRHLWDNLNAGEQRALRKGPLRPITVTNAFDEGRSGAMGAWSDKRHEFQVWLPADVWMPEVIPDLVEKHDKLIPKTVRHELQHATQVILGALTGQDYGGLPKRKVRQPHSIEEQRQKQIEDNASASRETFRFPPDTSSPRDDRRRDRYYRSDLEYQTSLTDAVGDWESDSLPPVQRWLDETDLNDRDKGKVLRWAVRTFVGEGRARFPTLPRDFKRPDWNPGKIKPSEFFTHIKGDRERWADAVATFYKEIARTTKLARRVATRYAKRDYPKAGGSVSGLRVKGDAPNQNSISASFSDYEVLPDVREVPLSDFDAAPHDMFYSASDLGRVRELAEAIEHNGWIAPLIVVIDDDPKPYILEGAHRLAALHTLSKRTFPALVVRDLDG